VNGLKDDKSGYHALMKRLAGSGASVIVGIVGDKAHAQHGKSPYSVAGWMKARIAEGIPPPLAEATIARKGGGKTTPLINTGQLRNSIGYKVEGGRTA
jgi:hypothetical protein